MLFRLFFTYYCIVSVAVCRNGILELLNPKNIADLTQRAMELGVRTIKDNQEANKNLNPATTRSQGGPEAGSDLPREFSNDLLRILSGFQRSNAEGASSVGVVSSSSAPKNSEKPDSSGCHPFVHGFMKIAYENCVQLADQKTANAWSKEVKSFVNGRGLDLSKASKETCKIMTEKKQCDDLRKAVSNCDVLNAVQIAMNMQTEIDKCNELIDENPGSLIGGMSELINGEAAKEFLNDLFG